MGIHFLEGEAYSFGQYGGFVKGKWCDVRFERQPLSSGKAPGNSLQSCLPVKGLSFLLDEKQILYMIEVNQYYSSSEKF